MNFIKHFEERFPLLIDKDFEEFFKISTTQTYKKGERIISIGDTDKTVFIPIKGIVRGFLINYKGKELTTFLIPEFQPFAAYEPIILDKPTKHAFECLEPTEVILFDYLKLEQLAFRNDRIMKVKDVVLEELIALLIKRNENFVVNSPEKRYLDFIEKSSDLLQRVSQKHIASYLGITAVSFSRLKKRIYKQ
jgi:CRP-like cAMP-binding protein